MTVPLAIFLATHKEWHKSILPVKVDGLLELVSPEAEALVALNVPDLDEANQAGLLHRGVGLVRAVRHQTAVDLGVLNIGVQLLIPETRK